MITLVQIELSLADPSEMSIFLAAAEWAEGLLLGTLATVIAVIAIAAVGYLMIMGRVKIRRGLTVVLGCFILFGAPFIARGFRGLGGDGAATASNVEPPEATATPLLPKQVPETYDPYAGAAVVRQ